MGASKRPVCSMDMGLFRTGVGRDRRADLHAMAKGLASLHLLAFSPPLRSPETALAEAIRPRARPAAA
jgi:hypothetical protein